MTGPLLLSVGVIVLWMLDRFVCRWVDALEEQDAVDMGAETGWFDPTNQGA